MVTSYNRIELVKRGSILVCRGNSITGKTGFHKMENYIVASGATAETIYVPLDPTQVTSIMMSHDAADTPTIDATITALASDDLEDSNVNYFQVYDGASTPYAAADTRPLIGLKIIADPVNGNITIDVIQTRRRR